MAAYISEVSIERRSGGIRVATLPGEALPVKFGAHGAIARHYGRDPDTLPEIHAATIDYIVAATAG